MPTCVVELQYYCSAFDLGAAAPPMPPPSLPTVKTTFNTGDTVRVLLDIDVFKLMQEGHGGWTDQILEVWKEFSICCAVLVWNLHVHNHHPF